MDVLQSVPLILSDNIANCDTCLLNCTAVILSYYSFICYNVLPFISVIRSAAKAPSYSIHGYTYIRRYVCRCVCMYLHM